MCEESNGVAINSYPEARERESSNSKVANQQIKKENWEGRGRGGGGGAVTMCFSEIISLF